MSASLRRRQLRHTKRHCAVSDDDFADIELLFKDHHESATRSQKDSARARVCMCVEWGENLSVCVCVCVTVNGRILPQGCFVCLVTWQLLRPGEPGKSW